MFTVIDPFKVYASNLYHTTGSLIRYPLKTLWQLTTKHHLYTADQNQASGGYAIYRFPVIHPTYGTVA